MYCSDKFVSFQPSGTENGKQNQKWAKLLNRTLEK
jgi:hypothetical protein